MLLNLLNIAKRNGVSVQRFLIRSYAFIPVMDRSPG